MRSADPSNRGLGLPELVNKYGDAWKNMGAAERKPYEDESKGLRVSRPTYTSQGREVSEELEEKRAAQQYQEYLNKVVMTVVYEDLKIENLLNKSFFFASFNVLLKTREDNKYYPNEIGIVEYSISKGIINTFHEFIDPGDVPMGYARIAKEHSEQFHKIPILNFAQAKGNQRFEDGARNFGARRDELANLVLEIVQMLDGSKLKSKGDETDDQFIVFCQEKQIDQVKGCFKFLCEQSNEFAEVANRFIVLDVVQLLVMLAARAGKQRPYGICEGDLTKSSYNYSANTNCDFHDEMDTYYCALGVAKRYCYMLSDVVCKMFNVELTEQHHPPQSHINFEVKDVVGFDFDLKPKMNRYFKRDREEEEEGSSTINQVPPSIRAPREFPTEARGATASAGPSHFPNRPIKKEKEQKGYALGIGRGMRVPQQKPNF
ncbi:protein maelstrom-like protein [Leptotrombidium deliense]|uniref:Protein maelstrom-like protein n=1 Tax=Leptotrombidium deliense TaxID=299467 RepID=A0A443S9I7_9ACAR|nr:protein maelstrom-like protein [Leptotrombidium deliense]